MKFWIRRELRAAKFPLYGLVPEWAGQRYVAGFGSELGVKPNVFELGHGARPGARRAVRRRRDGGQRRLPTENGSPRPRARRKR